MQLWTMKQEEFLLRLGRRQFAGVRGWLLFCNSQQLNQHPWSIAQSDVSRHENARKTLQQATCFFSSWFHQAAPKPRHARKL
jgi:hypothetical protein